MRHRPRAVHRHLLRSGSRSCPATRPSASSRRSGARAAERWGVAVGDRVAVEVFQSCRECDACRAGEYRRCERHGLADMYGFIPVDRAPGLWGGYAEHQYLAPDSMLLPVPAGLDPVVATLFNPLGAGIRWAVTVPGTAAGRRRRRARPGRAGTVALLPPPRRRAPASCMVTGLGPSDAERLALAPPFGADLAVDVADRRPGARPARRAPAALADVVVDVTAKAPAAFAQALALARPAGTVVVAGTRGGGGRPGFSPDHDRVQGAAGARRARRRRRRLPGRARPARLRPLPVRRRCPGGASASTAPRTSCGRWPARAAARPPCTGC